jgi:hypothetical protein
MASTVSVGSYILGITATSDNLITCGIIFTLGLFGFYCYQQANSKKLAQ